MELEHSFSVSASIDDVWRLLVDIERIAPCIPGATIESVNDSEVSGALKIKLGTIGPTYKGTARITDKDPEGHRAVVHAAGETRSNGAAVAKLIATLSEFGASTSVMLVTDVEFTGKPAELDQAVISGAGERLVKQFAERIAALLESDRAQTPGAAIDHAAPASLAAAVAPSHHEPPVTPAPPDELAVTAAAAAASEKPQVPAPRRPRPSPHPPPAQEIDDDESGPGSTHVLPTQSVTERASTPAPAKATHAGAFTPHLEVIPEERRVGQPRVLRLAPIAVIVLLLGLRSRQRRRR